jgi:hypothetical protein
MADPTPPPGFVPINAQAAMPPPPPGFVPLQAPGQQPVTSENLHQIVPLPRVPGTYTPDPPEKARFGDSLKPMFGGHNPIAETIDLVGPALDPRSSRPLYDRAVDTGNFIASLPFQALHLPTPGRMIEAATGSSAARRSEDRFVENNPDLLKALAAAGEVAGVSPMGQGFQGARIPPAPTRSAIQASEDAARAQGMVQDMQRIGVTPYAPAVAAARHSDNSSGTIVQTLADKPFIGTPIQRGARQFVDEMADAQGRLTSDYGNSRTMQGAGANIRGGLEEFKSGRGVDVKALQPAELEALAKSPPRVSTFADVAAAKYELAERYLPETKAKAQPVAKGEERVMGGLENTSDILRDIKRRYGLTINKSEAARAGKGKANDLSLENTVDFSNPRWTGSPNIDRSLDAIAGAKGNWRTGIEGMREIRSMIRRVLSAKPDSEVNALSNADLKRLYSAVSRDMDSLLTRLEQKTAAVGNGQLSQSYRKAREAYRDADAFYARHSKSYDDVRGLLNLKSDESAAGSILTAMRDGTRGNRDMLLSLRRTLPKDVIDELASSAIVELGRPTGRASGATQEAGFSPSRFASQWNSLSEDGKRLMFGHRPELKRELDAFARVAQGMADFEALANSSRTGVSNAVWGVIGAGSAGVAQFSPSIVAGAIGTALAGRSAAHFLSSQAYVRWLTRAGQLQQTNNGPAIMRHARQLVALVRNDSKVDEPTKRAILMGLGGAGRTPAAQPGSEPAQRPRPAP